MSPLSFVCVVNLVGVFVGIGAGIAGGGDRGVMSMVSVYVVGIVLVGVADHADNGDCGGVVFVLVMVKVVVVVLVGLGSLLGIAHNKCRREFCTYRFHCASGRVLVIVAMDRLLMSIAIM